MIFITEVRLGLCTQSTYQLVNYGAPFVPKLTILRFIYIRCSIYISTVIFIISTVDLLYRRWIYYIDSDIYYIDSDIYYIDGGFIISTVIFIISTVDLLYRRWIYYIDSDIYYIDGGFIISTVDLLYRQ